MRYMVALDGSQNSHDAFEAAIRGIHNPKEDELYLITVAERAPLSVGPLKEWNKRMEKVTRGFLVSYNILCKEKGVTPHCILGRAGNAGELICQAVDQKQIDFLYVGRRGLGWGQRLLAGSVSRYLIEHANCNVIVVKGSYQPEQHDAKNEELRKKLTDETKKKTQPMDLEVLGEKGEQLPTEGTTTTGTAGAGTKPKGSKKKSTKEGKKKKKIPGGEEKLQDVQQIPGGEERKPTEEVMKIPTGGVEEKKPPEVKEPGKEVHVPQEAPTFV